MATGKIKTMVRDRGFGFIAADGGKEDVFFHSTSVADGGFDALSEGQSVEYDNEKDPRNPSRSRAGNVRVSA
jgi:CspA family cold shock protein